MWFTEIAAAGNPGRDELMGFLYGTRRFLRFVLENTSFFGFLWEHAPELQGLAWETFNRDVTEGAGLELDRVIPVIPQVSLHAHGLVGRPLRFKIAVLNSIANQWESLRGQLSVREWFRKVVDAIDAILDSLIDAAGTGGIIKEFKDALAALG